MTDFKLGRKPQRRVGQRFAIQWAETYVGDAPDPTYPIDVTAGITVWPILGNGPDPTLTVNGGNPTSDCMFVGWEHDKMIGIALGHLSEAEPTADETVTIYLTYDGGVDDGVIMADALLWLYQNSYITAFAPVQLDRVDAVMAQTSRGILLGVFLTDNNQQETEDGLNWTVSPEYRPDPTLGHVVLKVGSLGQNGQGSIITWNYDQLAEGVWFGTAPEEAWVILTPEDQAGADPTAWTALIADLDALPGAQGTGAPPPPPPPVITPPPDPGPAPLPPSPDPPPDFTPPTPDVTRPPDPPFPLPIAWQGWWGEVQAWIAANTTPPTPPPSP